MTYRQAHEILAEHQKWRRGIGKYEWGPTPEANRTMPCSPHDVGEAIDCALAALAEAARGKEAAQ